MQAADIDAVGVTVTEMTNIVTVFDVVGEGTTAVLENIMISSNNIAESNPRNLWTGINIRENAVGTIADSSFVENDNMRHVFSASMSATLDVQRSRVVGASGGRVVVSHFKLLQIDDVAVFRFCDTLMLLFLHIPIYLRMNEILVLEYFQTCNLWFHLQI